MKEGELAATKLKKHFSRKNCAPGLEETVQTRAERINECEKGRCGGVEID
jgi:hypothetical protein